MVARKRLTVSAVGLAVSLLAQHATGAEARAVETTPAATESFVDSQLFRNEIEGYVRELSRQMRVTLNEDLRRELAPKVRLQRRGELQISLEKRERLLPRLVCSLSVVVRTVLKREGVIDPRDDQHLWRRVRLGKAMRR